MADEDNEMHDMIVAQTVVVHRPDPDAAKEVTNRGGVMMDKTFGPASRGLKKIIPKIGELYSFTTKEMRELSAANPRALRFPRNETKSYPAPMATPRPVVTQEQLAGVGGGGAGAGRFGSGDNNPTGALNPTNKTVTLDDIGERAPPEPFTEPNNLDTVNTGLKPFTGAAPPAGPIQKDLDDL